MKATMGTSCLLGLFICCFCGVVSSCSAVNSSFDGTAAPENGVESEDTSDTQQGSSQVECQPNQRGAPAFVLSVPGDRLGTSSVQAELICGGFPSTQSNTAYSLQRSRNTNFGSPRSSKSLEALVDFDDVRYEFIFSDSEGRDVWKYSPGTIVPDANLTGDILDDRWSTSARLCCPVNDSWSVVTIRDLIASKDYRIELDTALCEDPARLPHIEQFDLLERRGGAQ
jgi:hypothetical protein